MLTPWAEIRLYQYQIENLNLRINDEFESIYDEIEEKHLDSSVTQNKTKRIYMSL